MLWWRCLSTGDGVVEEQAAAEVQKLFPAVESLAIDRRCTLIPCAEFSFGDLTVPILVNVDTM